MSSVKSLQSGEKSVVTTKDDAGPNERNKETIDTENTGQGGKQITGKTSSLSEHGGVKAMGEEIILGKNMTSLDSIKTPRHDNKTTSKEICVAVNANAATTEISAATKTSKTSLSGSASSSAFSSESNKALASAAMKKATEVAVGESTISVTSKNTGDSKTVNPKKERIDVAITKPMVSMTSSVAPKQSQQHSKPHTQQQNRYFVPSRQNQEETVFKMVQNIFKLLETRGPLTMAQLEYNLPLLVMGSSPPIPTTSQTTNATSSKTNPGLSRVPLVGDNTKDAGSVVKKQNSDSKISDKRSSVREEKLIPGNMVPDIVELLVTLGLIQQQADDDGVSLSYGKTSPASSLVESNISQQEESVSAKNQVQKRPRFAVHFGKPKQFLVTPTNILSEISKAQTEIQLSRQRQELLKEALDMSDQHAAERVKYIVLQHPQVVDDPVYVTALRNLQVDGMLMAGASGTAAAGNLNSSQSSATRDSSVKQKAVAGGSGKKVGGGKRRHSGSAPLKRKRQRSKRDPSTGNGDANSDPVKRAVAPSGSMTGSSLAIGHSKKILPTSNTSLSNAI